MKSTFVYKLAVLSGFCAAMSACGSSGDSSGNGPDTDTGTETSLDTETTDAGNPDDTGEPVEKPPELPALCELITEEELGVPVGQQELSGRGDGSLPDIQFSPDFQSALAAWAYFDFPNNVLEWQMQTVSISASPVEVDGGLSLELTVGTVVNPATSGTVAEDPALAAGANEFGLVWRDGRWDENCDLSNFTECRRDLAFMALDETGGPVGDADPVQLTVGIDVENRPEITAVAGGYLVTWTEKNGAVYTLMGARIGSDGSLLETSLLSDDEDVDELGGGVVASNEQLAVIVWATRDRNKIVSRVWRHDESAPSEEISLVADEGGELLLPKVAGGDNGFLVAWSVRWDGDAELFLRPLDDQGEPVLVSHRATWTDGDILSADVAAGPSSFALAWASEKENGETDCVREECNDQIFAAVVGEDGALEGLPVRLSDDPNTCRNPELAWDGEGWTAVWESRRLNRWQLFYGQMMCL